MHVDYKKICRVCMSNGSRDIFIRSIEIGNPLERLLEKLRYVTMMKIEENDDLPRLLCDLCIVQLNVAYNFKQIAIQNDTKLRQYYIENGISGVQPNNSQINETSTNTSNSTSNIRNPVTNSNISPSQKKNTFPIIPIIIKEEPNEKSTLTPSLTSRPPTNSSIPDKNSMVYLNGYNLANLRTDTNDVEMFDPNDKNNIGTTSKETDNTENPKPDSSNDIRNDTNKFYKNNRNIKINLSDTRKQLAKKRLGGQLKTRIIRENNKSQPHKTEIKKLSINMLSPMGKLSRNEMKKNLDYTALFKPKFNPNKSNTGTNAGNLNIKTSNPKVTAKNNNTLRNELLLNLFNENDKNKKKGRKHKSCNKQNEGSGGTKLLKPKIEPGTKN